MQDPNPPRPTDSTSTSWSLSVTGFLHLRLSPAHQRYPSSLSLLQFGGHCHFFLGLLCEILMEKLSFKTKIS